MDYMEYRYHILEEKIEECISKIESGETNISVSQDDLTYDEMEYIKSELEKRLKD